MRISRQGGKICYAIPQNRAEMHRYVPEKMPQTQPKDHQTIQAQWDPFIPFYSPFTVKALTCWLVLDLPSGKLT